MAKPDFLRRDPILCNFSIVSCRKRQLDHKLKNYSKLGLSWENLAWPFNFFWNFALETLIRMSKWLEISDFKFQYWRQPKAKSNILCCCCCYWWWYTAKQPRCTARTALLAAVTVEASEASGGVTAWCQLKAIELWSFQSKEIESGLTSQQRYLKVWNIYLVFMNKVRALTNLVLVPCFL